MQKLDKLGNAVTMFGIGLMLSLFSAVFFFKGLDFQGGILAAVTVISFKISGNHVESAIKDKWQ